MIANCITFPTHLGFPQSDIGIKSYDLFSKALHYSEIPQDQPQIWLNCMTL